MIGSLISLLLVLLFLVILYIIVQKAGARFGVDATIVQIIGLILFLIFLLYALQAFGLVGPGHWRLC
jgi:hypothetical protein